jgi:hypothetical protein
MLDSYMYDVMREQRVLYNRRRVTLLQTALADEQPGLIQRVVAAVRSLGTNTRQRQVAQSGTVAK